MTNNQKIAILALVSFRGDNTERARRAFRIYSPEEMKMQHGISGKTRAEVLADYGRQAADIDAAIAWVRSIKP